VSPSAIVRHANKSSRWWSRSGKPELLKIPAARSREKVVTYDAA